MLVVSDWHTVVLTFITPEWANLVLRISARISQKVEGDRIGIEIGSFFNAHLPFKEGDKTSRAVIVPGTTIGSGVGGGPRTPPSNSSNALYYESTYE